MEKVLIKVKETEKAEKILKEKFELEVKTEKDNIEIVVQTDKLPEVIKELAINDVKIKAVIPKEHSLEEIFFDATKNKEEPSLNKKAKKGDKNEENI